MDWLGTLTDFKPGSGCKLKLSAAGSIEYRDPSEYTPHYGKFESTMNLLVSIDQATLKADLEKLRIGAFVQGECHGVTELEYIESLDAFRGLLMVMGIADHDGKEIELRVFDETKNKEYVPVNAYMPFGRDQIIGDIPDPYVLYFDDTVRGVDGYQL